MTKLFYITQLCLLLTVLTSCNKTRTVIISKFENGNPQETIEYNLPITKDSIGLKKVFFKSGKLQAFGQTEKGKRNGDWVCYYENGKQEWRAHYDYEVENGELICYDTTGNWRKMVMVNGCKNGKTTEYFYNRFDKQKFFIHGQYSNCLEQGLWTKTDSVGTLLIEMTFVQGERVGYFTNRYKNGQIRLKGELQKSGSMKNFTFFDESGKPTKRDSYIIERI